MNKETDMTMNLNPYFESTIETSNVVWSHDENSYQFNFDFTEYLCDKPFDLTDGKPRILLEFLNDKNAEVQIYPLIIDSEKLGVAHFIIPERVLGYVGDVKASLTIDFSNKSYDLGNFMFKMKKSPIDNKMPKLQFYVDELEKAIEKADELNNQIKDKDLVTKPELEQELQKVQSGFLGEFNSVAELKAKYPNGEKGYAVVFENSVGYTYTYKDNAWVKGNVWNGMAISSNSVGGNELKESSITAKKLSDNFNFVAVYEADIDPRKMTKNGYYLLTNNSFLPAEYNKSCILELVNAGGWKELRISSLPLSTPIKKAYNYKYKFRGNDDAAVIDWQTQTIEKNSIGTDYLKNGSVTSEKIANNSVSTKTIEDESVTGSKIRRNAVSIKHLDENLIYDFSDFNDVETNVEVGFFSSASTSISKINVNPMYNTIISDCSEGELWSCNVTVAAEGLSAVIFWKEDGTFHSDLERSNVKDFVDYVFSVPKGAVKFSVSSRATGLMPSVKKGVTINTKQLKKEMDSIKENLIVYNSVELKIQTGFLTYASSNVSKITPLPTYRTIISDCSEGELWNCDVTVNAESTSAVIFWKEDGTFHSDLERATNKTFKKYSFRIPKGVKKVSVTSLSEGVIPVLRKGIEADLSYMYDKINSISGDDESEVLVGCLGDSIEANHQESGFDIATLTSKATGYNFVNLGCGGTMAAKRLPGKINGEEQSQYDAFSLHAITNSLATNDFTVQENALGAGNTLPAYYRTVYNKLQNTDWSKTTLWKIRIGTNDWTHIDNNNNYNISLDNESDKFDIKTYAGALRYSIENLYKVSPESQIMLISPTYRFFMDSSGNFLEDSNTKEIRGKKLTDFVGTMKKVAKEYGLPFVDNYFDLGLNKANRKVFFDGLDGTHPNKKANKKIATKEAFCVKKYI